MTLPNFLVIGVARSGTSSMYHYLLSHPDIFMSTPKELNYFTRHHINLTGLPGSVRQVVSSLEDYQGCFSEATTESAIGEASPSYSDYPEIAENIRETLGHIRIIVHLRHPADRAYSQYQLRRSQNLEPIDDFLTAFDSEQTRAETAGGLHFWSYQGGSFYADRLAKYFDTFGVDHIQVNLFDDFEAQTLQVVQTTYAFLGVDPTFDPDVSKVYYRSVAGHRRRLRLMRRPPFIKQAKQPVYPPRLSDEVRKELTRLYVEDIRATQEIIQRDLSGWLHGM